MLQHGKKLTVINTIPGVLTAVILLSYVFLFIFIVQFCAWN